MLAKILSIVETSCRPYDTINPQQIVWSSRVTVDRLVVKSHDSSIVVNKTTVDDDDAIDLLWRNCLSPKFARKFQGKYPNFWRYPNFHNKVYVKKKKAFVPNTSSIRLVVSIHCRLMTDEQIQR